MAVDMVLIRGEAAKGRSLVLEVVYALDLKAVSCLL
jgi:hypothetical protein